MGTARLRTQRLLYFCAIGFGVGAFPIAPGTLGTLVAVPIYLLLRDLAPAAYLGAVAALFIAGIGICRAAEQHVGVPDYPAVVWDEIVGYLLTMFLAPPGWAWVLAGFVLFRLFDIWKPFPIRWIDRNIKGAFGTMLDDAAAAVYAFAVLQALAFLVL